MNTLKEEKIGMNKLREGETSINKPRRRNRYQQVERKRQV